MPAIVDLALFQIEIDARHVTGPAIRLREEYAFIEVPGRLLIRHIHVGLDDAVIHDQRRHLAMRVAHQNHINSRHLSRDGNRRILVRHLRRIDLSGAQILFDPHVHRNHNHVNFFLLPQNIDPALCLAHVV